MPLTNTQLSAAITPVALVEATTPYSRAITSVSVTTRPSMADPTQLEMVVSILVQQYRALSNGKIDLAPDSLNISRSLSSSDPNATAAELTFMASVVTAVKNLLTG